jgi:oxygen-dependent protoporphyrinogen oxidase
MLLDYIIPPRRSGGDESLAAFVRRRFGAEAYKRMIEPLMSGIYGGDGDQLSLAATFPNLRKAELEHGSLIRGMRAAAPRLSQSSTKWPAFLTLEKGIQEVVDAITNRLGAAQIRLRTHVRRVVRNMGYQVITDQGEVLAADAVILATPAFVSAGLMADIDPVAAQVLHEIPYGSTVTVSLAYPLAEVPRRLDGYGYIVPRSGGRPVLACTWTSTKFPHRAPQNFALIRAFLGRAGQDEIVTRSDGELLKLVGDELRGVLGITTPPCLERIFRWPQGMPQYTLGHLDRVNTIEQHVRACSGLYVAGSAYRGVGIPDCIASGEQAAEKALTFLNVKQSTEAVEL